MKTLSVIVLSKNNGRTIGYTLLSILRAKIPLSYTLEVIVVDARSNDNTPRILKLFQPYLKRVVYDEGKGIGIARNMGVLASKGEVICFVDSDCLVGEEHFTRILQTLEGGADIVDVQGVGSYAETKVEKLEELVWRYGKAYSEEMREDRCFAGGAFISFKRLVFEHVKGFWLYPPYGADDLDFSYRARRLGFKIKVVEVPGTISRFRRDIMGLIKQQMGWGKGTAHAIARYRLDPNYWKCYRGFNFSVYKILGRYIWLYPIVAAMVAPLMSVKLAIKAREPELLFYWTVRRWAFLYGVLRELRRAFIIQGAMRRATPYAFK